jgi:cysteinyl-tRNA synthetase
LSVRQIGELVAILLYNTLTREKQEFEPLDPKRVTMYVCGPTVYNYAHIGNARPAVIFDLLHRVLSTQYPEVVYARNITDVDDKINEAALKQQVPIDTISARFSRAYHEDMACLGVGVPTVEPRATDHIEVMVEMIQRLMDAGHAYAAEGHVLFNIESYPGYGNLSRRDMREMVAGARIEVAPFKKHPGDFVLWKPSSEQQPGWDSPWGRGRPGWHLECSAMAESHLGPTIDIHGGGMDLMFPHHENEIAQSVCSHEGSPFARYWMHNGFVTVDKCKMSKSLGNTLVVHELLETHRGETLRFLLLSAHYRQPLDWSEQELERAHRTLDRLYGVLRTANDQYGPFEASGQPGEGFLQALCDDLNTPVALAEISRVARELAKADTREDARELAAELLADAALIGLLQETAESWFGTQPGNPQSDKIEALIEQRNQARAVRDFATADAIRDKLNAMGIALEDAGGKTLWRKTRDC